MLKDFLRLKKTYFFLIALSIVLSLFTALQAHMNNWLIFKSSFHHLLDGSSLYHLYPNEHHDLYKYSPTFALFMAPLAFLPSWLGACLWNLLGTGLFLLALLKLPLSDSQRKGVFWISLPEFIGSTQGFQSNIHMVALLMLFWVALEEQATMKASFCLMGSFFIKIFGLLGGCLFIFSEYSTKRPKLFFIHILTQIKVFTVLAILPAVFVGWDSLMFQYQEWLALLKMDAAQSYGFSLMGVVHGVTGWDFDRLPIQIAGGLSLLASFFYFRKGDQTARMVGLIALCYFLILFNHKSESPTFIIAMMAFGIHQSLIANQRLRWSLIAFTMGCVSLMYSDLFREFKQSHFDVYSVKAWPFLILYPMALTHWGLPKKRESLLAVD